MITLDIEASGLDEQRSYPIEIAWVDVKTGESDSFLINPESSIDDWSYWDLKAELIHQIPRELLIKEGISVQSAAKRLNEALAYKRVVSDSHFDRMWTRILFEGTDFNNPSPQLFKLLDLFRAIKPYHHVKLTSHLLLDERPHRALADARIIADAIRALPVEAWS